MSQLPTIASRQYSAPTLSNSAQQQSGTSATRNGGAASANTSGNTVGQSLLDQISLSKSGVALSAQGMSDRAEELGNNTLDVAQGFLSSFAQQLFGDAANGATVTYDSASLESQSGFAAMLQQSSGTSGSSSFAGLSLNESSHFIGKGTITTADGQSFDFEIEVQYESRTTAVAQSATSASSGQDSADGDSTSQLPTLQLPDVKFPGNLSDLFKLLGQQLQTTLPATTDDATSASQDSATPGGTLLLRLRNLMNTSALIGAASTAATANNTALGATDTTALTKAVSNAYGNLGGNGGTSGAPASATWTDTAPAPLAAPVTETPISLAPVTAAPDDNTI